MTDDLHVVPHEQGHEADPSCWCQPATDYEDIVTGRRVWLHHENADLPRRLITPEMRRIADEVDTELESEAAIRGTEAGLDAVFDAVLFSHGLTPTERKVIVPALVAAIRGTEAGPNWLRIAEAASESEGWPLYEARIVMDRIAAEYARLASAESEPTDG